jgi:hypothetical protein
MLPANLPGFGPPLAYTFDDDSRGSFWEDVYLVAIEAPMGFGSNALDRVVGAIAASLPADLRKPERCWIVQPQEWKAALGLKAKPTAEDITRLAPGALLERADIDRAYLQHGYDAYCIAKFARDENAKALVGAASTPTVPETQPQRAPVPGAPDGEETP